MKSILTFLLILAITPYVSAQKYSRVKVLADDQELRQIADLGVAVDHGIRKKNTFIITDLSEYEIDILNEYGYPYEIEIDESNPGGATTQVQFNNSGAFDGDANLTWTAGTALTIGSQKELRLADTSGGEYVGLKSAGTATSYTMTLPAAVGASGTALVTTDGSGTLGFTATSTFGITTGKAIAMAIVFG